MEPPPAGWEAGVTPAERDAQSRARTLQLALQRLSLARREALELHLAGAHWREEGADLPAVRRIFAPLLEALLAEGHVQVLRLGLAGPSCLDSTESLAAREEVATLEGPKGCLRLEVKHRRGFYHEVSFGWPGPDLVCAFQPGFWGYGTWAETLRVLAPGRLLATSYNREEAELEQDAIQESIVDASWASPGWEPEPNPFAAATLRAGPRQSVQDQSWWQCVVLPEKAAARSQVLKQWSKTWGEDTVKSSKLQFGLCATSPAIRFMSRPASAKLGARSVSTSKRDAPKLEQTEGPDLRAGSSVERFQVDCARLEEELRVVRKELAKVQGEYADVLEGEQASHFEWLASWHQKLLAAMGAPNAGDGFPDFTGFKKLALRATQDVVEAKAEALDQARAVRLQQRTQRLQDEVAARRKELAEIQARRRASAEELKRSRRAREKVKPPEGPSTSTTSASTARRVAELRLRHGSAAAHCADLRRQLKELRAAARPMFSHVYKIRMERLKAELAQQKQHQLQEAEEALLREETQQRAAMDAQLAARRRKLQELRAAAKQEASREAKDRKMQVDAPDAGGKTFPPSIPEQMSLKEQEAKEVQGMQRAEATAKSDAADAAADREKKEETGERAATPEDEDEAVHEEDVELPAARLQDQPADMADDESVASMQDRPADMANDMSGASLHETPADVADDHLITSIPEKPADMADDESIASQQDKLAVMTEDRPAAQVQHQPADMTDDQSIASLQEKPSDMAEDESVTSMQEKLSDMAEDESVVSTTEKPADMNEDQSAASFQRPADMAEAQSGPSSARQHPSTLPKRVMRYRDSSSSEESEMESPADQSAGKPPDAEKEEPPDATGAESVGIRAKNPNPEVKHLKVARMDARAEAGAAEQPVYYPSLLEHFVVKSFALYSGEKDAELPEFLSATWQDVEGSLVLSESASPARITRDRARMEGSHGGNAVPERYRQLQQAMEARSVSPVARSVSPVPGERGPAEGPEPEGPEASPSLAGWRILAWALLQKHHKGMARAMLRGLCYDAKKALRKERKAAQAQEERWASSGCWRFAAPGAASPICC
ncbi:unnamed protein product [Effrenium voratum]|nr:unnamed protein product [Effrenium voratum]